MASMETAVQRSLKKLIEKGLPVAVANTVAAEVLDKMAVAFGNKKYFRDPVIIPGGRALRRYFGVDTEKTGQTHDNGKVIFLLLCGSENEATQWDRKPLDGADATVYSILYGKTDKYPSQPANDKGFDLASI